MKAQDLRTLGVEDLQRRLSEMRAEYYSLEEAVRLGKERNHARLSHIKRDIARALSVLREGK